MEWSHEYQANVPAVPARVFRALTEPAELTQWLAEHMEVELRAGGRFAMWGRHTPGTPPAPRDADRLISLVADERLEFSWEFLGVPGVVTLQCAPEGEETRLSVRHTLRAELAMPRAREFVDDWWRLVFANLCAWVSGGRGLCRVDFADPAPEVRLTIDIAAPREAVFRALLDPALVNQWIAKSATIEPQVGGRYDLGWRYEVDGREVVGGTTRILELREPEYLVLDWLDWRGDASVTGQYIAFTLEALPTGTRVHFRHAGFSRPGDISDYAFGWVYFLDRLAALFPA